MPSRRKTLLILFLYILYIRTVLKVEIQNHCLLHHYYTLLLMILDVTAFSQVFVTTLPLWVISQQFSYFSPKEQLTCSVLWDPLQRRPVEEGVKVRATLAAALVCGGFYWFVMRGK